MSIIDRLAGWFHWLFEKPPIGNKTNRERKQTVPPVKYSEVLIVEKPPINREIEDDKIYTIVKQNKFKWTLFMCPCGCQSVITLSLQKVHRLFWLLSKTSSGRATLNPSGWRDIECLSHFWIKDGRVYWCKDTGIHPKSRKMYE